MDYWLSFLTGFFGSMHCVGMCGAIVLAYSSQQPSQSIPTLSTFSYHLAYNIGRILSYTIVGGIFGFIGGGISGLKAIAQWFSFIGGIVLIILGIYSLKIIPVFQSQTSFITSKRNNRFLLFIYRSIFVNLIASPSIESKFYVGLLTPLLPCGLSYSMFIKAASTMDPITGALVMFFFGVGIAPALILTGIASSFFSKRMRNIGEKLAALTVIIMGIMLITHGVPVHSSSSHMHHMH